jgi:adenylate cyclase
MEKKKTRLAGNAAILLASFAAVALFGRTGMYSHIEHKIFDSFFHLRDSLFPSEPLDTPVTIVGIDKSTLDAYRAPVIFWDREFAETIRTIASARPRAIGFDVLHLAQADSASYKARKERLKKTILATPDMVLPYSAKTGDIPVYISRHLEDTIGLGAVKEPAHRINFLSIAEKITGSGFGFVELPEDDDGVIRRAALTGGRDGAEVSFPLRLFMQYHGIAMSTMRVKRDHLYAGSHVIPLDRGSLIINFPGPPGAFPAISMIEVIRKKKDPAFLARHFRNRAVLIGVWDRMLMDIHNTPYVSYTEGKISGMYGVEIIAGILDTMLRRRYILRSGTLTALALCLLFALGGVMLTRIRAVRGIAVVAVAESAYLALAFSLFVLFRYEIAAILPLLALPVGFGSGYLFEHHIIGKDRALLQSVLRSYLDPRVVERVVSHGDTGILKGRRRVITVLFSDIRDFTSLSENIKRPEVVVEILNVYLSEMCGIILAAEGCVDKFIGDGIMAFWNAPNDVDNHAAKAVRCALDMQERMHAVNDTLLRKGLVGEELKIGIGINTGAAVVGNIGGETKNDYTAIGDTVNLASRLEGKTKDLRCNIIISGTVFEEVSAMGFPFKPLGRIEVKGKKNKVRIFGIKGETR